MNDRPDEEAAAQATLLAQNGVDVRTVVVGNGCRSHGVLPGALTVCVPKNIGIPGGRCRRQRAARRRQSGRVAVLPRQRRDFLVPVSLLGSSPRPRSIPNGRRRAGRDAARHARRLDEVRHPMSWRTVYRLTAAGRPPII
jgi:hypothetical protein